jgi:hypothetical protein
MVCVRQEAKGRVSTPEVSLGMAGEPDTRKRVRPVRWEAHRNLVWQQTKALCVHPIANKAEKSESLYDSGIRKSCTHGETILLNLILHGDMAALRSRLDT